MTRKDCCTAALLRAAFTHHLVEVSKDFNASSSPCVQGGPSSGPRLPVPPGSDAFQQVPS